MITSVFPRRVSGFPDVLEGRGLQFGSVLGLPGTGPAGCGPQAELAPAKSRVSAVGRRGRVPVSRSRLVADVGKHCPSATLQCP